MLPSVEFLSRESLTFTSWMVISEIVARTAKKGEKSLVEDTEKRKKSPGGGGGVGGGKS